MADDQGKGAGKQALAPDVLAARAAEQRERDAAAFATKTLNENTHAREEDYRPQGEEEVIRCRQWQASDVSCPAHPALQGSPTETPPP